eukprot:gene11832-15934_t
MPIVLLEQDVRALVLLRVLPSRRGLPLQFEVLEPGINAAPRVIDAAELYARYEGHCLLFKLLPKAGAAGGESDEAPSGSNWLWRTVWHYRRYYYDSIIASILINVLSTLAGLFAIHVYDRVIPHKAYSTLWALVAGVTVAMLFEAGARHLRDYLVDLAARKSDITLASALFRQALGLRLEHTPPSS